MFTLNPILLTSGAFVPDANGNTVGGGEILHAFDSAPDDWKYMDYNLMQQFKNLGIMKLVICALLLLIAILILMRILGIRSITRDAGISAELENIRSLKRKETRIVRRQSLTRKLKSLVHALGLDPDPVYVEYMNYNLKRAGILDATKERPLDAFEYNAYKKAGIALTTSASIIIMFLFNATIGFILLCLSLLCWAVIPDMIVRNSAALKDAEIRDNFFDFYAEIHYVLRDGAKTPLSRVVRSYARNSIDKPEMQRFANNIADLIDLHGEYESTQYISKEYRELPEVTKLMRLIRQFNENADIKNDLEGFRNQLLTEERLKIEKRQQKLIKMARMSFNILMIVLMQAILSAMMIYIKDLGGVGNFF